MSTVPVPAPAETKSPSPDGALSDPFSPTSPTSPTLFVSPSESGTAAPVSVEEAVQNVSLR